MQRFPALSAALIVLITCPLFAETLAVLPFFNLSDNPNLTWAGESVAAVVSESLSGEGLVVSSREDRLEVYRRLSLREDAVLTRASVVRVAEALDADYVIYGQFRTLPAAKGGAQPPGVEISGRVIDIKRLRQSGEFRHAGKLTELAALQANLAWDVLKFLRPEGGAGEAEFKRRWRLVRLDAIENYVRGIMAGAFEQKHRFLTQAARLDESFSQPRFQLGRLHMDRQNWAVAAEWFKGVQAAASNAREARFLEGLCRYHAADFAGARAAFASVAAEVPLNEVFNNLGAARARLGDPEAARNFRRAIEGDSADPDYHFNLGWVLWKGSDFEGCAASFETAARLNPEDPDAAYMFDQCRKRVKPRAVDSPDDPLPKLKHDYQERAWRQLKEMLEQRPTGQQP